MKETLQRVRIRERAVWLVACALLVNFVPLVSSAQSSGYSERFFDGSPYVQQGPGSAYSQGYINYGGNATGLEGRFGREYGAIAGYGRFGAASGFGTGPLRTAGTGHGREQPGNFGTGTLHKKGNQTPNPPKGKLE